MFVEKSMAKNVTTITQDAGIETAREKMDQNGVRHLPVVDAAGRLIGVVTDRDVRSALPSIFRGQFDCVEEQERIAKLTVADIMTKDPVAVTPTHTLPDVLLMFQTKKFGAFPVVDEDGKLVGIISVRDLLRAFINVLNIGEPGVLLGVVVDDKLGQTKNVVDIISEEKIPFGSVLTVRHWEKGKRAIFPYLLTNNVARLKGKLKERGYAILDPMDWHLDQLPTHD